MAKKKTTHPLHMHVPTKIGFTLLAIAIMVYGLFLASAYNSNNQTASVQSHAASNVSRCTSIGGVCKTKTSANANTGDWYTGLCPGPASEQCFVSTQKLESGTAKNYGQSGACSARGGHCESTVGVVSSGSFVQNLCPGPATWQCYISINIPIKKTTTQSGPSASSCAALGEHYCPNTNTCAPGNGQCPPAQKIQNPQKVTAGPSASSCAALGQHYCASSKTCSSGKCPL